MTTTNISITRGDTKVFITTVGGVDKPLAGAAIASMFRRAQGGPAIISKSLGAGIVVTSDVVDNRKFEITLLPADTSALSVKGYRLFYDIQITYSDGYVATIVSGCLNIIGDVTY